MKKFLVFITLSLATYLAGILLIIWKGPSTGAILVIGALLLLTSVFLYGLLKQIREKRLYSEKTLYGFLSFVTFLVIIINGFVLAINQDLNSVFPGFRILFSLIGFLLIGLFFTYSNQAFEIPELQKPKGILLAGIVLSCLLGLAGLLGFMGMLPVSARLVFYSWVFLVVFFFLFSASWLFFSDPGLKIEKRRLVFLALLMLIDWVVKWHFSGLIPDKFISVAIFYSFPILVILPLSIFWNEKFRFYTVFVIYTILLEHFFLFSDQNFNYLSQVGTRPCVDYDKAIEYKIITNPGLTIDQLFEKPSPEEIATIRDIWKNKDFSPRHVKVEALENSPNGDSLTVISHRVGANKHYGLVYLPAGVNPLTAPILLVLPGKGGHYDVFHSNLLKYEIENNIACADAWRQYMLIMPSYRGNVVKGETFCYRSHGFPGDSWLGATEDALMFLEAVKGQYHRQSHTKVISLGASRGATVALMMGALTDKVDHVISISTHTAFHNRNAYEQFPLHDSYPSAFYTPLSSPEKIRQRLIASSPVYFADQLPDFEIHQGTEDPLTTVMHAKLLEEKLKEMGKAQAGQRFYFYPGKGHGYYDSQVICQTLKDFIKK